MKQKVIAYKNQPTYLPLWPTLTTYLALDRFNAPDWAWGAIGFFFLLLWISRIVSLIQQQEVEILK